MKNSRRDRLATYEGNPGGKPIYPNTIDHGYDEPLAGGTDVMRRLQNQLLHEQGSDDLKRPESPRLASYRRVAEAYNDRTANTIGTPIGDFIGFMDANAVRFPKGPIGWWLPAHNMAIRLTRENKIMVLRYQILPDIANPFRAHQPNNPKGPTLGLSPMWWKHERLGGFYSIGMAERFLTLAAHEPTVMATVRNELQSLTDLYGNPVNVPPELVTKLSMNAAKNAIARWGALRIRNIPIPL